MSWKIAEAKHHFSDVVRRAARKPQLILHRDRPVAAVIAAEDLDAFLAWRAGEPQAAGQPHPLRSSTVDTRIVDLIR